jgi:peroxiredoxin (alkyl hydroperoxide reductase subunit C)
VIAPGAEAPDFTLRDHGGREISLSSLLGSLVMLVFYPLDFSPVCTDQLSIYQEVLEQIEERGLTLIGVSVDSTWAHSAFRKQLGISIPLLSDFEPKGEMIRSYGAYLDAAGHGNRSLVLIDEHGVVRWVHESPTPLEIPGANLIFDALAEVDQGSGESERV